MKPNSYFIMGNHAVEEVFKTAPKRLIEVYSCQKGPLLHQLERAGIKVRMMNKQELSKLVDTESHQSIVAKCTPPTLYNLKKDLVIDEKPQIYIALDQIYDPHNFGAILRSAECFSASGVIWSKNRGAGLTPIVSKVSSGASELVRLYRVSNLVDALGYLKKQGFILIAASFSQSSKNLYTFEFPEKSVVILGSEGKGVQPLILKNCDEAVYIPMKGSLDSLNVSQASSVILSNWAMQVDQ